MNTYETGPYFLQLSQNMATNYLFTFVFLTKKCHEIAWRHKIHVRLQKIFWPHHVFIALKKNDATWNNIYYLSQSCYYYYC